MKPHWGSMPERVEPKLLMLSWNQFFDDVARLAFELDGKNFDALVAVARGGFVAARLISDIVGVKRVGSLAIEYYKGVNERASSPRLVGGLGFDVRGLKLLVVDDVADTGETLKLAVEYLKSLGAREISSCTVYVKPWCRFKPDYYARVVEAWVVFPYEHLETARYLLSKGWTIEQLLETGFYSSILEHLRKSLSCISK